MWTQSLQISGQTMRRRGFSACGAGPRRACYNLALMAFSSIPEVLEDLKAGKMVVLVDDEDRENEGDLVIAAEKITPAAINFMVTHARGVVCLALTPERCDKLALHPQTDLNTAKTGSRRTCSGPGTSIRCAAARAACSCARGRRKARSTWRGSRG